MQCAGRAQLFVEESGGIGWGFYDAKQLRALMAWLDSGNDAEQELADRIYETFDLSTDAQPEVSVLLQDKEHLVPCIPYSQNDSEGKTANFHVLLVYQAIIIAGVLFLRDALGLQNGASGTRAADRLFCMDLCSALDPECVPWVFCMLYNCLPRTQPTWAGNNGYCAHPRGE